MTSVIQAKVSVERISKFLNTTEWDMSEMEQNVDKGTRIDSTVCLFVISAVHFTPYLAGLSRMMLI